eukprot:NODE_13_length_54415_cov_0.522424.p46 type:complete len:123 gc:universal NODE_13_length_54415_cov_0.522424:23029-22661(-)
MISLIFFTFRIIGNCSCISNWWNIGHKIGKLFKGGLFEQIHYFMSVNHSDPSQFIASKIKEIDTNVAKLSQKAQRYEGISQQQSDPFVTSMLSDTVKDMQTIKQRLGFMKEGCKEVRTDFKS